MKIKERNIVERYRDEIPSHRAFRGAFRKGLEAGYATMMGQEDTKWSKCPYKDKRKWNGKLTWSRAFQTTWDDGFTWGIWARGDNVTYHSMLKELDNK